MGNVIKFFISLAFFAMLCYVDAEPEKRSLGSAVGLVIDWLAGKITSDTVSGTTKSLANAVIKHYSTRSAASLTIGINNNLAERNLVNPILYLTEGATIGPAPVLIKPLANEKEPQTKVLLIDGKIVIGRLCYHCVTQSTTTHLICMGFDTNKKKFAIKIQQFSKALNEEGLKKMFPDKDSDWKNAKTIGKWSVLSDQTAKVVVLAQMTTGVNARLVLDIIDTPKSGVAKREPVTMSIITGGLIKAAVPVLLNAAVSAYNYFKLDQVTIITVDNLSTKKDSLILQNPIWVVNGALINDIIPETLRPNKSSDITLTVPFGKGGVSTSVSVMSFFIHGSNYRLVLANWWPRKFRYGEHYHKYAVLRLKEDTNEDNVLGMLNKLVKAIQSNPKAPKGDITQFESRRFIVVEQFQRYFYWRIPIQDSQGKNKKYLKVLTGMGSGRENAWVVKVFVSTLGPNEAFDNTIPEPKDFTYEPEQIPPDST